MTNSSLEEFTEKALAKAIQSTRIKLVELSPNLAQSIFDCNSGTVKDYFIDFKGISEVKEWIAEYQNLHNQGIKLEFVILDKSNSRLTGMVAMDELHTEKTLIRMWINPVYQNQGYAKEACGYIISAFKNLYPAKLIIYTAETKNIASLSLAKSLGFVFTRNFIDEDGLDSVELVI
jgi:RimJ/RimL family protein N-acetyltransferase